VSTVIR